MDSNDLHIKADYLGSCGIVLTPEQKASLQTSLTILKYEQKFSVVHFWGIIRGTKNDYYIAQGIGKDFMKDVRTIYSKDCICWGILPIATKASMDKSTYFKMRFTGDPSFEFDHVELTQTIGDKDEIIDHEEIITMKEEDRLAAVIKRIDNEAKLVPRGAFIRHSTGQVVRNRNYEGMNVADASKLCSYFHFRPPQIYAHLPLQDKTKLDKSIDFLDTIEYDVPKGCWVIQLERGRTVTYVKSLNWLGYVLYHVPDRPIYGSLYVGTGEYNIDLPFML